MGKGSRKHFCDPPPSSFLLIATTFLKSRPNFAFVSCIVIVKKCALFWCWTAINKERRKHQFQFKDMAPFWRWHEYIVVFSFSGFFYQKHGMNAWGKLPKKNVFFGISFPNLFTHPPTPGFLWDLGKRKVKFGSKKAIFGANFFFFLGVWTLFGNQPPHPLTFGKDIPKKSFFYSFPYHV